LYKKHVRLILIYSLAVHADLRGIGNQR
jgi:hypothetical protein